MDQIVIMHQGSGSATSNPELIQNTQRDLTGRPTSIGYQSNAGLLATYSMAYVSGSNRLASLTTPAGTTAYSYTANGQLTQVGSPGEASFGNIQHGKEKTVTVSLDYAGRSDWQIKGLTTSEAFFTATAQEESRSAGRVRYNIALKMSEQAPEGAFQSELIVVTNDRNLTKVPLRVMANIVAGITASPTTAALGQGMHDAFNVNTPFGSFNPLDMFGGAADSSAAKGLLGPSGGVSRAFFRGGHAAKHSLTTVIQYGQDAASTVKRFSATVSYFFHSKLGQHIIKFPEYVKAAKVKIRPTVPPGGRAWENLSDIEKGMMSKSDIFAATEKLRKNNGGRLPAGMSEVADSSGRPTGQLWVGNVPHTWHHSHRKGEMELIPTQLHRESIKNQMPKGAETVGPHIGHALWWKNLW